MTPTSSRLVGLLLLALVLVSSAAAEPPGYPCRDKSLELEKSGSLARETPRERDDRPLDVLHYDLDLTIDPQPASGEPTLIGRVRARLTVTEPLSAVSLNLVDDLTVDGVLLGGDPVAYTHAESLVTIPLGFELQPTEEITITVDYRGRPLRAGLMGFTVRNFTFEDGTPDPDEIVVATLSEPDVARTWWPCHDTPYDAATFTLSVTGPEEYVLGSAGELTEDVPLPGGLRRQTWDMPVPVPAYLVSIAYARYESWQETTTVHRWPTGEAVEMPLQYYSPSVNREEAEYSWSTTARIMETFERLFGPYPYADLKYGMALFVFGGAMEHPTLSSMGRTSVSTTVDEDTGGPRAEWIVAHELCHQWFGDCVRVERWGEIWLNEGFARYSEALWLEEEYGTEHLKRWMERIRQPSYPGTLLDPDQLFGRTSYDKGAWTLHMLRQVMGREELLEAMRAYVTDPDLRFSAVSTADFQGHCEAVYGESLDWFFEPWLNREGRPSLELSWALQSDALRLTVTQPATRAYRLPLPVRLRFDDGSAVDEIVWIEGASTTASVPLPTGLGELVAVQVDPDDDWLLDFRTRAALLPPFPNPFNPRVTVRFAASQEDDVAIDVYDARGRRVRQLYRELGAEGLVLTVWDGKDDDGRDLASGVYYIRMTTASGVEGSQKATLIR